MKIGILTFHRSINYGAFLQALSLCERLNEENDISAEIIDYDTIKAQKEYSARKWTIFRKLRHIKTYFFTKRMESAFFNSYITIEHCLSKKKLVSDDYKDFNRLFNKDYDVIIVGSDEVWNVNNIRGFPNAYYLIGDFQGRKFSYAASGRADYSKLDYEKQLILKKALSEFEFISVRDESTLNSVKKVGINDEKLTISCDPSFLSSFDVKKVDIADLARTKKYNPYKKNVLVMCRNKKTLADIRNNLASDYNLISAAVHSDGYINLPDLNPFQWLALIKSCDCVISSFFHGICFSIVNNTPFIAIIENEHRGIKVEGLLNNTELADRILQLNKSLTIDWQKAVEKAQRESDFSTFVSCQKQGFDEYLKRLRSNHE